METIGPNANLKDWSFPTQEAKLFMGENLVFNKQDASSRINANLSSGISKFIVIEFMIIPKYLTFWTGGPELFSSLKTHPPRKKLS